MVHLMSFRAYANHIGVHPSSVSRAVARGRLPTVLRDGVHLIDPVAADAVRRARKDGSSPSPEKRAVRSAQHRARLGCGFDLGQMKLLAALRAHGPRLLVAGMEAAGSTDPFERARAAATLAELIEWAATALHTECNSRHVQDCREVLPARLPPSLPGHAETLFETLVEPGDIAGPLWPDDWHSEVCRAFGPARL